jgi:hypothetical protein
MKRSTLVLIGFVLAPIAGALVVSTFVSAVLAALAVPACWFFRASWWLITFRENGARSLQRVKAEIQDAHLDAEEIRAATTKFRAALAGLRPAVGRNAWKH